MYPQATNESTRESTMGFLHKLSAAVCVLLDSKRFPESNIETSEKMLSNAACGLRQVGWEAKAMQFCAERMRSLLRTLEVCYHYNPHRS